MPQHEIVAISGPMCWGSLQAIDFTGPELFSKTTRSVDWIMLPPVGERLGTTVTILHFVKVHDIDIR